jgi:hypothetical protein
MLFLTINTFEEHIKFVGTIALKSIRIRLKKNKNIKNMLKLNCKNKLHLARQDCCNIFLPKHFDLDKLELTIGVKRAT